MARAAHRLGPKDKKNVGGELRDIHIRICPSVAVCYTAGGRIFSEDSNREERQQRQYDGDRNSEQAVEGAPEGRPGDRGTDHPQRKA